MKTYKNVNQLHSVGLYEIAAEMVGAMENDVHNDFSDVLGGDVHLVEERDDLLKVEGTAKFDGGLRTNPLVSVPGYDSAHYLPSGRYAMLFLATNNAGGDAFFVPREVADQVPNVRAAIEAENEDGQIVRSLRGPLAAVKRVSPLSGKQHERLVPMTAEDYEGYVENGLQWHMLPDLTQAERDYLDKGVVERELA